MQIIKRLDRFRSDGPFYKKTGRAHKLGLLLYGPPGGDASGCSPVQEDVHWLAAYTAWY